MLLPGDTEDDNDNITKDKVVDNYHEFYELLPVCEGGGGGGAERHQGGNTRPSLPDLLLLETRTYSFCLLFSRTWKFKNTYIFVFHLKLFYEFYLLTEGN